MAQGMALALNRTRELQRIVAVEVRSLQRLPALLSDGQSRPARRLRLVSRAGDSHGQSLWPNIPFGALSRNLEPIRLHDRRQNDAIVDLDDPSG